MLIINNELNIGISNPLFLTALLVFPIAYKTKDMFTTMLLGMGILVLIDHLMLV